MNAIDQILAGIKPIDKCDLITSLFGVDSRHILNNEKIIIYGAGSAGRELCVLLTLHGVETEYFCDSNAELQKTTLLQKPVISYDTLVKNHRNRFIVIGVQKYKSQIFKNLRDDAFNRVGIIEDDLQFYYYLQFPRWKIDVSDLTSNSQKINRAFEMLQDKKSQDIFVNRLSTLASGADFQKYRSQCILSDFPQNYPLEKRVFAANFENQMYFENDIISINQDSAYLIDAGAFDGDSYLEFARQLHLQGIRSSHAYLFEPDRLSFDRLKDNLKSFVGSTTLYNNATWYERANLNFASSVLMFETEACIASYDNDNEKVISPKQADSIVSADSIDNLIYPQKVGIIKMDVEGSESQTLRGAAKTISKHHPQLIISAYHRKNDIWELPLLVQSLSNKYSLFYRQFSFSWSELCLIAKMI